ncbi:glycosyltransferase family 2 protein [Rurimicrobium arvi]|uniref:Glycosyltransferase 2-like domain-containing protein n=1 Tax=Rurimicrobium arvi TaxID=2049916 RepID=A0ABP8MXA1_9BACT
MRPAMVSIVIPFYNEERYLLRSVNSALSQTYTAVEIILVNDGSDDGSAAIAARLAGAYDNVLYIDAPHHSPGHARNLGIGRASGTYITFLDADDELEPDAVEVLMRASQRTSASLTVCRFSLHDPYGNHTASLGWSGNAGTISTADALMALYTRKIVFMVCARLYRTDLVRKCPFPEGQWFEDTPFLVQYLLCSECVTLVEDSLYRVHAKPASITRATISCKRIGDAWLALLREYELLQNSDVWPGLKTIFLRYQIQPVLLNLFFLAADRKELPDSRAVESAYEQHERAFAQLFSGQMHRPGFRTWYHMQLLSLYRKLGWNITCKILPYLKRKQFRTVQQLRSRNDN